MGGGRRTALNLSSLPFSSSYALAILGMVLVDGSCVDVLIIVCLKTEESFVLSELVPSSATIGLF